MQISSPYKFAFRPIKKVMTYYNYTIRILGCPKCKNVFYKNEIDPQLERYLKAKGIEII